MAPFGLFKKKDKSEEARTEQPVVNIPQVESLSISQAQAILQEAESSGLQALSAKLTPVKSSVAESLAELGALATEMEREKIKLEDLEQRFKSLVENSRKTIVSSLRREAANEFELPKSVNEVRRFKEKFESMLNRFGEVSGSHSKIMNNFMKKQSTQMKQEFEDLREQFAETKSAISEFEQRRAPLVKCNEILNTASQKIASLQNSIGSAEAAQKEIDSLKEEISKITTECEVLKSTEQYSAAAAYSQELVAHEEQMEELRKQIVEHFSYVSRALTKYSYGVSKETERRLSVMAEEPWQLLSATDAPAYLSLLGEVRKSISSGTIQLKDSDKMLQYIDTISLILPDFQNRSKDISSRIEGLKARDLSAFYRAREMEESIEDSRNRLTRTIDNLQLLKRQNEERKVEADSLLAEASGLLSSITGQKCSIKN